MVSPRKRILQASTSVRSPVAIFGGHNQPNLQGSHSKVKVPLAFKEYKFFLDLKEGKSRSALVEDIKSLGGQLEECLSKEATHLISDCPLSEYPQSTSTAGPPSPWTPTQTQTPSPATSTSAVGGSTERTRRSAAGPGSRAEAILAKARPHGKAGGGALNHSRQVLETALRLKIQVWSYQKTLLWLQKFRDKYGSLTKSTSRGREQSESKNKKTLIAPSLKLESSARNLRPVFAELKTWPSLHYDGRSGSCPYTVPSSRQKNRKLAKRLDLEREQATKPSKKDPKCAGPAKKKTSGFCEICNLNYADLDQHLLTDQHVKFVSCVENWKELDAIVSFTTEFID
jgi:hypothetical protein